jgi:hypothetical protein
VIGNAYIYSVRRTKLRELGEHVLYEKRQKKFSRRSDTFCLCL